MKAEEIYDFIKPHLGNMSYHGETNADMTSLDNFGKRWELINLLLEDAFNTYNQAKNRPEASAIYMIRNIKDMLEILKSRLESQNSLEQLDYSFEIGV